MVTDERDPMEKRDRAITISQDPFSEFQEVDVLNLPEADGVEQVAWAMKKIIEPLRGKVVEIGIDATSKKESNFRREAY